MKAYFAVVPAVLAYSGAAFGQDWMAPQPVWSWSAIFLVLLRGVIVVATIMSTFFAVIAWGEVWRVFWWAMVFVGLALITYLKWF